MDEQKIIDIKVQIDKSDVDKSFKNIEKQSDKMSKQVSKDSKKTNDTMTKNTQQATSKMEKQFKDLHKQMTKALDATQLSSKLSNSLNKIKAQLNSALGNIQMDVQVNTTIASSGVVGALAGAGAGIASSGAIGATLQKSLSQAHKASQGLVENTKKYQKHLSGAVSDINRFNQEMKSVTLDDTYQLDNLSTTLKSLRKYLDFADIMKANNMTLKEAEDITQSLIMLFTNLNGVFNTNQGIGAYINQLNQLYQVEDKLSKQKRGMNYGAKLISPESLQSIQQLTAQANTATNTVARLRVRFEEFKQSAIVTKIKDSWSKLATSFNTDGAKFTGTIDKIIAKTKKWLSNHTKTGKGIQKANKGIASSFKSLMSAMLPFMSIYAIFTGLKNAINNAMESIETDNMFDTVFGSSADEMNKWVSEMNSTLGLGITNTKKYTATISQMGRAMGLSGSQAKEMAQKMASMAGDISSFYDTDLETVQADLRSALSGSMETMDKYGILLRANTIKEYAYANGIANTGAELTNAQRAMATTMMIEEQLGLANGDLARSINSPANQARILKSNLSDLSVALGKCFTPILTVVLPILNTFVQALTTTINAIANFISQVFALFGVNVDFGGVGGVVNDMASSIESADVGSGGLSDNLASGADSAKEIQKFLSGIDELNIVTTKQDSGSSGSGGGGSTGGISGGNIDTGAIDSGLAQTETKFSKWAEKVASALQMVWGSLKDGWNSVGDYITSSLDKLKQSFANLGKSIESFLIGCWNNGGEELIYNIGRLAGAFTGLALDIGGQVVDSVAKLFDHMNPDSNVNSRKFIKAMNECLVACQNFALSAGGWLETFMSSGGQAFINNVGDIATIVGTILVKAFDDGIRFVTDFMNSFVGQAIIESFAMLLEDLSGILETMLGWVRDNQEWLEALGLAVLGAYGAFKLINGAIKLFNGVMMICSGIMTALSTAGTILAGVIAFITSPIGLVILAIGALIAIGVLLWQNWDTIKAKCAELWQGLQTYWSYITTIVVNKCTEIKDKALEIWTNIKEWVITKVTDIKDSITEKFTQAYTTVTDVFTKIKTKISETIGGARDAVKEAIDKIKSFFNFEWSLPKLKLPHISISGSFSLNPISVPSFGISWHRQGGILPAGSNAIFGMNGNNLMAGGEISTGGEAILPLSDLFKEMKGMFATQNKQLVSQLGNGNNQPINLVLNLDGDKLAKAQYKSFKELAQLGIVDFSELV